MLCSQPPAVYRRHSSINRSSTDTTAIELPFKSTCLSRKDRDPESRKIDGALAVMVRPLEAMVSCCSSSSLEIRCYQARRCLLCTERHTQQWVYVRDKQWPLGCNPLAGRAEAVCGLPKTNCRLFACFTPQEDPNWAKSHYLWLAVETVVLNVAGVSLKRSVRSWICSRKSEHALVQLACKWLSRGELEGGSGNIRWSWEATSSQHCKWAVQAMRNKDKWSSLSKHIEYFH